MIIEITLQGEQPQTYMAHTALEKAEIKQQLLQEGVKEQFVSAAVKYDDAIVPSFQKGEVTVDGHARSFIDFDEFIAELGKFGT